MIPGNEGRQNYVLRLNLRRAARHGRILGFTEPFLSEIADVVIDTMGTLLELVNRRDFILRVIHEEENRFQQPLNTGLALLDDLIERSLGARQEEEHPGADAFRL